jgi:twitching motility protein PilT
MTIDEVGLSKKVLELCYKSMGLILVTGPTGSGKTTTLATLINYINETFPHHIITIEDPIEYVFHHRKSIVNQREIGEDVHSFADALRAALREDPDVILVGEMRDLETIEIALRAAETGHLVFGNLAYQHRHFNHHPYNRCFPSKPTGAS